MLIGKRVEKRVINWTGNVLAIQLTSKAVSIQMSRPSMHRIIKYSSDLRGFLILAPAFDPSGTKLSISTDASVGSDATPLDGTDSFIGL